MEDINIESYFNKKKKYYDSEIVINILEDILNKPIKEIKTEVNDKKVVVTKEEIESYLEQKFIEEDPELKRRIENPKPRSNNIKLGMTEQDIEDLSQRFIDNISSARYCFEPYTLEYFNKYTNILKNKINLLLNIIEKISNKDSYTILETLNDLDIKLDNNGNILKSDIIRLIKPTIYNINDLDEKLAYANDLSTYLTFKMSKHSLLKHDLSEGEIYPKKSLQIKDLYYGDLKGYVSLSEGQRKTLKEEQERNSKKLAKLLINL